ncbi:MAG: hypothetical protein N3H84_08580 [Candidatus Caldarchaeum sp.]|nr:hypothetical protein [Candidatus Caldarchaeum sp.]
MNVVRCVCGSVVNEMHNLRLSKSNDVDVFRCANEFCGLEKIIEVSISRKGAELKFSPMFSDYNLLFMGRDALEESLKKLGERALENLGVGKGLKRRIRFR